MFRRSTLAIVTLAATTFCSPAALFASVGGDDHFGGSETSAHSSWGGDDSSFGNTGANERSSSHQGGGGFSVESLAQVDHIGPGGSHVVDSFKVNSYYDTAEYLGRTVTEEGTIQRSMQLAEDRRKAQAFEDAKAAKQAEARQAAARSAAAQAAADQAAAAQADATQQAAAQEAARVAGEQAAAAQATADQAAAAQAAAPSPDMGAISAPPLEITPGAPRHDAVKSRVTNLERRELEKSLRAVEHATVTHVRQDDSLTKKERKVARVVEDVVGVAMGAAGGRWFGGGLANHGPRGSRLAEIARRMAPLEGAALGLTKAELHDYKRVDRMVQDTMRFTRDEAAKAKDHVRSRSPEDQATFMDAVRGVTAANEQREADQRGHDAVRQDPQANREGSKGNGKGSKGGNNSGRGKGK